MFLSFRGRTELMFFKHFNELSATRTYHTRILKMFIRFQTILVNNNKYNLFIYHYNIITHTGIKYIHKIKKIILTRVRIVYQKFASFDCLLQYINYKCGFYT